MTYEDDDDVDCCTLKRGNRKIYKQRHDAREWQV